MAPKAAVAAGPIITAQAPCRADLAGGTVDLWPLYLFHPGALTLNFAVEILTTCRITPLSGSRIELRSVDTGRNQTFSDLAALNGCRKHNHLLAACAVRFFAPERGLLLETDSQSPAGAGISGSSAMMIATCAALARYVGRDLDLETLRVIAQNV
jgi:D-glycero-alpha-D-manno-heptose-7-phosphate kinase